jgi:hypothetical protein
MAGTVSMGEELKKPYKLLELKPFVPIRTVKDYSDEEQLEFQNTFKPVAEKYRRRRERGRKWGMAFMVLIFVGFVIAAINPRPFIWLWLAAIITWLIALVTSHTKLLCPACQNKVNDGYGTFCPQCGKTLKRYGVLQSVENVKCAWCGILLGKAKKGRNYRIRLCTYCGVTLDPTGI